MPKMDGFAACREMRKQECLKSVPIVMVTSRGEARNVEEGYRSGCNAYLTKPINAHELLEVVQMFVAPESRSSQAAAAGKDGQKQ
jgi:CheY-like chemotaxis protein